MRPAALGEGPGGGPFCLLALRGSEFSCILLTIFLDLLQPYGTSLSKTLPAIGGGGLGDHSSGEAYKFGISMWSPNPFLLRRS